MSLLEDVFLQDEAGEAQELERVIEGDEFDERPRSAASNSDDNSEKDDEAEEDKQRVDPTKAKVTRVVKNPRVILNPARLTGPRGIQVIPDHFKDFKFKGKGHEKEDLDLVLKKLEHWAYRLFPKFEFGDCLKKIETLGKKRPVMVHLQKIRSDQYITEETVVQRDSSDDEAPVQPPDEDEFDKLLQQQIELARATPAPGSVTKRGFETPSVDKRSSFTMPKATSSPSISDEQRDRMIRNRQLAEERRLAKLKQNNSAEITTTADVTSKDIDKTNDEVIAVKHNRSNVINRSDDEDSYPNAVNRDVTIDVDKHDTSNKYVNNETTVDLTNTDSRSNYVEGNAEKYYKSNVIDSSDDEDSNAVNRDVTIDVQMHEIADKVVDNETTVDLTTDVNKSNSVEVNVARKHRSNVIDSSDDEDTNSLNRATTVDVEMHVTADLHAEVNNKTADIINSKQNVTVDLTEGIPIKHSDAFKEGQVIDVGDDNSNDIRTDKHKENNLVDSSDDECEVTALNHSVSVDLHSKSEECYSENNEKRTSIGKSRDGHESEVIDEDLEEIGDVITEKDNKNEDMEETTKEVAETLVIVKENENNASEITNERHSKLVSETSRHDKENVDCTNVQNETSEGIEELMDVDFSDDF